MRATKELTSTTPANNSATGTDAGLGRVQDLKRSSATLAKMPERLEFPPRLRQRIVFDARRERLFYYGFMTKADYDLLRGLNSDASYQQALEQLFRESSAHSVVVDIGVDKVLDDKVSLRAEHSAIWRLILMWGLTLCCVAVGTAMVFWMLHILR